MIRFIFIRHGQGCHNVIGTFYKKGLFKYNDVLDLSGKSVKKELAMIDPELTSIGVGATKKNARILKKVLEKRNINKIDLFLCSTLLRTMETGFYTKRELGGNDKKIYVCPFLREIDESSDNPKSESSRQVIETVPEYAMKPVEMQQRHLQENGILGHISFNYLDPNLRKEPGDIKDFINWLFSSKLFRKVSGGEDINIVAFTHAGVLKHFMKEGFYNNTGFILELDNTGQEIRRESLVPEMTSTGLFTDYEKINPRMYCEEENNRCSQMCDKLFPKMEKAPDNQ